eukprot:6323662-Prymnesium_polylepis.1
MRGAPKALPKREGPLSALGLGADAHLPRGAPPQGQAAGRRLQAVDREVGHGLGLGQLGRGGVEDLTICKARRGGRGSGGGAGGMVAGLHVIQNQGPPVSRAVVGRWPASGVGPHRAHSPTTTGRYDPSPHNEGRNDRL